MSSHYLLDTHALIFWWVDRNLSKKFLDFLDQQARDGQLFVSSLSFWETALLDKKGRLNPPTKVQPWHEQLMLHSGLKLIEPSAEEMMESVFLPDHHRDPFDRLLITQAQTRQLQLVSKDRALQHYDVEVFWMA